MNQKKLYRTIETVASKKFESEEELLIDVLNQIVAEEEIIINGGRIWELDPINESYSLIYQIGKVETIQKGFKLDIEENSIFERVVEERTVLTDETNEVLISKGILKYSASGVGEKIKVNGKAFYKYLFAVNADEIDRVLLYTLNIVATVLTSKLHEKKISTTQKTLLADIDKAKELQKSILPDHEYSFHGYEIFGVTIPAAIVSGDFFDYITVGQEEERLGITVGDAASKGLAASAEAMYISGAIRMASTFQLKISPMMYRLNNLVNKIFSDDRFATLFYGEISNDQHGLFLYANAGHNWPIFIDSKTKKIRHLEATGPLLGPAPKQRYETGSLNFNVGDVLVIYSDGITEAANNEYDMYEEERLEKIVLDNLHKTPREITYAVLDDVVKFSTHDSRYQDDKTLVVIKRNNNELS